MVRHARLAQDSLDQGEQTPHGRPDRGPGHVHIQWCDPVGVEEGHAGQRVAQPRHRRCDSRDICFPCGQKRLYFARAAPSQGLRRASGSDGRIVMDGSLMAEKDKELLQTARHRMTLALSAWSETREDQIDDLRFYAGSPDNHWQWPADVLATRGSVQGQSINARPTLTINKLPQHVRQVTNDQRQNRPSGKVIPADDKGDVEVAEIYDGIVCHIEYISDADVAYDTACENQVAYGEGYIRILTEYTDPASFDQDIKIGRVRNSFSVYMDPMIQDPCGSDAQWCFITEDISKEEYERQFPNAQPISSIESLGVGDQTVSQWINENTVRIADYYYIEHTRKTLNLYYVNVSALSGSPEDRQMVAMGMKPIRTREVDIRQVKYCKINGFEVLERNDWAGEHIPVVRVVGNEFEVDGRIYLSGSTSCT